MRTKFVGFGLAVALAGVLLSGCGNEAKVAEDGALGGNNSLIINAAVAGTMDISRITWIEDCFLRDPGVYSDSTMTVGATGTRIENLYSDAACITQTGSDTLSLIITNDGSKTTVNWVDEFDNPVAAPAGVGATVTATKVTISGTDSSGAFSFKTLLFVNDVISPMQLLFGNHDALIPVLDAQGYPDNIFPSGAHAQ